MTTSEPSAFNPKDHAFCEQCGARVKDGDAHTFEVCEMRQRLDLFRHIRDELRRLNIHVETLAVAAKNANDKSDELRRFYGKVIEERRRARNAVVKTVLGKSSAVARGDRPSPKKKARR